MLSDIRSVVPLKSTHGGYPGGHIDRYLSPFSSLIAMMKSVM